MNSPFFSYTLSIARMPSTSSFTETYHATQLAHNRPVFLLVVDMIEHIVRRCPPALASQSQALLLDAVLGDCSAAVGTMS
jgi:hypothetical protein